MTKETKEKLIDFKKMGAIMQKNLIVLLRDKTRIIPLMLFPIFMILVFGYTSGNIPKHIPTAIVVSDNSQIAQQLQQEIANSEVFSVRYVVSTEGEAKRLLDNGDVRVIVEIPPRLQESIDNDEQPGITVIVDESDASIAGTAHSTLSAIINTFAGKIAGQRLASLQASVGQAGTTMQDFINAQPDMYGRIIAQTSVAETILSQSKAATDQAARAAILAAPAPSVYVAPSTHPGNANATGNNTYTTDSSTPATAGILQQSSAYAAKAQGNVHAATQLATQAQAQSEQLQNAYAQRIEQSLGAIKMFSHSKTESLLRPLVYEEKPAYGTGKRPVDFLIPTIIALTIFQGAVMGMGRAVAGEKREGSLTRVFLTPTSNATIITGTLLFYIVFELLRSVFLIVLSIIFFSIKIEGSLWLIALILIIYIGIPNAIGMIISSMVKTEGQYMAMAMLVSMPTIFLAGAFFPLQAMPKVLQILASFLPVTYAAEALRGVMIKGFSIGFIIYPLFILVVFLAACVGLLFMVFKRDIE